MPPLRRLSLFLLLAFNVTLALLGTARADTDCGSPAALSDGWNTASPASVGIDPEMMCNLVPRFADWKEADVHAILVARHGKLIFEQYYSGADQHWGEAPA